MRLDFFLGHFLIALILFSSIVYPSVSGLVNTVTIEESLPLIDISNSFLFNPLRESLQTSDGNHLNTYSPLKERVQLDDSCKQSSNSLGESMPPVDWIKSSSHRSFEAILLEHSSKPSYNIFGEYFSLSDNREYWLSIPSIEYMQLIDLSQIGFPIEESLSFNEGFLKEHYSKITHKITASRIFSIEIGESFNFRDDHQKNQTANIVWQEFKYQVEESFSLEDGSLPKDKPQEPAQTGVHLLNPESIQYILLILIIIILIVTFRERIVKKIEMYRPI